MLQALLTQLQNPDPAQRTQAINTLGTIRHPRARQALRYVYFHDPDPAVRNAALQYLPGLRAKVGQGSGGVPANARQPTNQRQTVWDCVFCGTRDVTGAACPNCGAPRPTAADEKAATEANALPDAAPLPGSVNPGLQMALNQGANNQPGPNVAFRQQQMAARQARRAANRAAANAYILVVLLLLILVMVIGFFLLRG